eukprot:13504633-Ditylum_brightwellii.AAC.1
MCNWAAEDDILVENEKAKLPTKDIIMHEIRRRKRKLGKNRGMPLLLFPFFLISSSYLCEAWWQSKRQAGGHDTHKILVS